MLHTPAVRRETHEAKKQEATKLYYDALNKLENRAVWPHGEKVQVARGNLYGKDTWIGLSLNDMNHIQIQLIRNGELFETRLGYFDRSQRRCIVTMTEGQYFGWRNKTARKIMQ